MIESKVGESDGRIAELVEYEGVVMKKKLKELKIITEKNKMVLVVVVRKTVGWIMKSKID